MYTVVWDIHSVGGSRGWVQGYTEFSVLIARFPCYCKTTLKALLKSSLLIKKPNKTQASHPESLAPECTSLTTILSNFFSLEACGILVLWPGIELGPLVVEAQSPNHWPAREVLPSFYQLLLEVKKKKKRKKEKKYVHIK